MINAMFFGINVILFIIVWKYVLKPSIIDHYRDKLFDLREEVRDYFISRGISLDNKIYKNLRDIINSHLRFTENMSLASIAVFSSKIEKDKEVKQHIKNEIERKFKTEDKELEEFIAKTRSKSIFILTNYMVLSSPLLIALLMMISCAYIPVFVIRGLFQNIKNELSFIGRAIVETSKIIGKCVATDDLEEISYETSSNNDLTSMA